MESQQNDNAAQKSCASVCLYTLQSDSRLINNEQMTEILRRAIDAFGAEHQKDKCIEECSELIDALMKERQGRSTDVVTEIADVFITVNQLMIIYGLENTLKEVREKLIRLDFITNQKAKLNK